LFSGLAESSQLGLEGRDATCGVVHVFFMGKCELGELEALQPGNEKTQKNKNKITDEMDSRGEEEDRDGGRKKVGIPQRMAGR